MIEAKPTLYNGIQFRSRLEARWAAMFDHVQVMVWSRATTRYERRTEETGQ